MAIFLKPIDGYKFKVVFGIVTHKDKTQKSKNLPLFSRISLMRSLKAMQLMSVEATFGFIPDNAPKKKRKKKRKKKGA